MVSLSESLIFSNILFLVLIEITRETTNQCLPHFFYELTFYRRSC